MRYETTMPHICVACGKPMAKTNQGFECQTVLCGFMAVDGHGAEYTEEDGVITINIKRDKVDIEKTLRIEDDR